MPRSRPGSLRRCPICEKSTERPVESLAVRYQQVLSVESRGDPKLQTSQEAPRPAIDTYSTAYVG